MDGVALAAPAYNPGITFTTNAAIGARGDNLAQIFLRLIDEVQIFDNALTAWRIEAISNAGSEGSCDIVRGIAELPEVAGMSMEARGSSGSNAVLASVAAAVAVTFALAGATWYARRRSAR